MENISIAKFIEQAHKELSLIENLDGEVIYSSCETFKKGKYYFLGLNPGGEGFISIKDSLDKFQNHTENDYFDASWNSGSHNYDKEKHPLQQRVQYLFENILNYDLRNVFSTNLIFETTKSAGTLNFGLAGLCWGVHEYALSVVQPEIILTCGNNQDKSAFSFIANLYSGLIEQQALSGTFTIKYTTIFIQNRPTLLIGLPHLSRFEIRGNEDFKQKLLTILGKNHG